MSYDANPNQNNPQPGNPHPQNHPAPQNSPGEGSWLLDGADPAQQPQPVSEPQAQEPDAVQAWGLERAQTGEPMDTNEAWMNDMQARGDMTLHQDEPEPAATYSASYCEPESTATVLSRLLVPGVFVAAISVAGMILWKSMSGSNVSPDTVSTAGIERSDAAMQDGVSLKRPDLPEAEPKEAAPLRGRIQRDGSISVVESTPQSAGVVGQNGFTPSKGRVETSQASLEEEGSTEGQAHEHDSMGSQGDATQWVGVTPVESESEERFEAEGPAAFVTEEPDEGRFVEGDDEPSGESPTPFVPDDWLAMGGFRTLPMVPVPVWGPLVPSEESERAQQDLIELGLVAAEVPTQENETEAFPEEGTSEPSDQAMVAFEQWEDSDIDMPFVWVDEQAPETLESSEGSSVVALAADRTTPGEEDTPELEPTAISRPEESFDEDVAGYYEFDSERAIASWLAMDDYSESAVESQNESAPEETLLDGEASESLEVAVGEGPDSVTEWEETPMAEDDADGFGPEDMVAWQDWDEDQHEPVLTDEEMEWLFADQTMPGSGGELILFPTEEHPEDSFLPGSVEDMPGMPEATGEEPQELALEVDSVSQALPDETTPTSSLDSVQEDGLVGEVWVDWDALDEAVTDRVELTVVESPAEESGDVASVESAPEEGAEVSEPIFEVLPLIEYGTSGALADGEVSEENIATEGMDELPLVAQDAHEPGPMEPQVAVTEMPSEDAEIPMTWIDEPWTFDQDFLQEDGMDDEVVVEAEGVVEAPDEVALGDEDSAEVALGDEGLGEDALATEDQEGPAADPEVWQWEEPSESEVSLEVPMSDEGLDGDTPDEVVLGPEPQYTGPMWPTEDFVESEVEPTGPVLVDGELESSSSEEELDAQDAMPTMQRVGPWVFPMEEEWSGELAGDIVPGDDSSQPAEGEVLVEETVEGEGALEPTTDIELTEEMASHTEHEVVQVEGSQAPEGPSVEETLAMEPSVEPTPAPSNPAGTETPGETVAQAPVKEGDLLSLYNDWTMKDDQGELPEVAGMDWMGMRPADGQASPFQLSQSGESGSGEVMVADADPEPVVEEPKGLLRRRTADASHWTGTKIPMHAMHDEAVLLTPRVGPVRVVAPQGETIEGRLHGLGQGYVWLENNLGRMTVPARRVERIERLDPGQYRPDRKSVQDFTKLPKVRVKVKGGVFIGHELTRDGNRITIRTEKGHKLTLVSDDIQPAGSFKPVNIRRDGSQ